MGALGSAEPIAMHAHKGAADPWQEFCSASTDAAARAMRYLATGGGEKGARLQRREDPMVRKIKADGETWQVALDSHAAHPGVRALVFHCVSNPQRPYRVTEVPGSTLPSGDALDHLSDGEVRRLFQDAHTMDYTHDPRAAVDHVGEPPTPPGRTGR